MATPTNLPAAEIAGTSLPASWLNDLRGAFRILQVVFGTTNTPLTTTSATPVDSLLTATITPQATSSKILVLGAQQIYLDAAATGLGVRLLRGSTVLQDWDSSIYAQASAIVGVQAYCYLDSPSTASAVTYKTQIWRRAGTANITAQINATPSNLILCEVSA